MSAFHRVRQSLQEAARVEVPNRPAFAGYRIGRATATVMAHRPAALPFRRQPLATSC